MGGGYYGPIKRSDKQFRRFARLAFLLRSLAQCLYPVQHPARTIVPGVEAQDFPQLRDGLVRPARDLEKRAGEIEMNRRVARPQARRRLIMLDRLRRPAHFLEGGPEV